ncbi:Wzz/FepE/Etk N-terminal domain-containing protein [Ruegeria sp. R14_0]|uniref:exopolysaccharide transport family protein n=1 Tax=Ruegeria sp. R14_0 TaxID=2821100 RepID=UPI001ADBDA89|nr:Wzz/FepE/Etk N-terminal domain-containing protein [Ruegeria sp. R14_0]MBO9445917.1 AAA family ATPase [Ruegeria sp. R14_0]
MTDQYRRGLDVELSGVGLASAGDPELRVLSNIAWAIRRSILWILGIAFAGGVFAYLLTYASDTKYTSSAKVMIETRVQTETQFTPQVSGLPLSLTSLESELQLLRSTDLIESVVDRLDLQSDPEFSGDSSGFSLSPIAMARGLKNAIVGAFSSSDDAADGSDGQTAEERQREATIEKLLTSRQIEQVGDTSAVYQIRVTSESPRKAANIANGLAREYLSVLTRMKRDDLEQSQQWLATRIGQIREDLNVLSSNLEAHSIETPYTPDEYATIKAQRIKAEKRSQLASDALYALQEQTNTINLLRDSGKTQEAFDFALSAGLLQSAGGTAEENTAALDAIIKASEQQMDRLNTQLASLNLSINTFKEQQVRQVQHDSITKRIENEILVAEAIYRDFVSQLGRRAEQGDYLDAGAHIIEAARVSVDPSEPRRSQTALGVMVAIVFGGIVWTVMHELFQKRLRTTYELESTTGIKLTAIIPEVKNEPPFETFFTNSGRLDPELLHYGRRLLASSDIGLRTLRHDGEPPVAQTNDLFSKNFDAGSGQRTPSGNCMIFSGASAVPDEGKTSTLLLIGTVCAQAGFRTLIIDCDTVTSTYRDLSQLTVDALKKASARPMVLMDNIVGTPQEGLDILPLVGAQDNETQSRLAEDFLCSPAFLNLLRELSDSYEVILLDTPPLLQSVESAYFSQLSQRVILLTRWNSTNKNEVLQAMRELENAGVRPSALVATRVDMKSVRQYGDPILG